MWCFVINRLQSIAANLPFFSRALSERRAPFTITVSQFFFRPLRKYCRHLRHVPIPSLNALSSSTILLQEYRSLPLRVPEWLHFHFLIPGFQFLMGVRSIGWIDEELHWTGAFGSWFLMGRNGYKSVAVVSEKWIYPARHFLINKSSCL